MNCDKSFSLRLRVPSTETFRDGTSFAEEILVQCVISSGILKLQKYFIYVTRGKILYAPNTIKQSLFVSLL